MATQLRGRGLSVTVLPFSFREFLSLKGIDYSALTGGKKGFHEGGIHH